jgi:hypothetical protein
VSFTPLAPLRYPTSAAKKEDNGMAYEKVDAFLKRHAIAVRILVIALILFGILLRIGISHIREYNRVQQLREQSWYLIGTCDRSIFLMFDAADAAELEKKMEQYDDEWRQYVNEAADDLWSAHDPNFNTYVFILIPNDEIKYGKTPPCDHSGFVTNDSCRTWRECAALQLAWNTDK